MATKNDENRYEPTEVTDKNYEEFIDEGVSLLDIGASSWCVPCKNLDPIIKELASDYYPIAKIGKMDVDTNTQTVTKLNVRSVPTIIIYKNGEIVERVSGVLPKSKIVSLIDKHLNN